MWSEFKKFAMKGNIIDLAVGIIIGGAFNKIVSSLVEDIIMPLIGIILGKINISKAVISVGDAEIKYGMFIQNIIDFVIIAFSVFIIVKSFNKLTSVRKTKTEEAPTEKKLSKEELLLTEIRDLLRIDRTH